MDGRHENLIMVRHENLIHRQHDYLMRRSVLGHFVFVYIYPYMDGNGRVGRFLMNVMLASGGYPWTTVPLERRNDYMAALESASVRQDIEPFAGFIGSLVDAGLRGQAVPPVPGGRGG
jgi:Fic family protein